MGLRFRKGDGSAFKNFDRLEQEKKGEEKISVRERDNCNRYIFPVLPILSHEELDHEIYDSPSICLS
jgi:hypothetical protein